MPYQQPIRVRETPLPACRSTIVATGSWWRSRTIAATSGTAKPHATVTASLPHVAPLEFAWGEVAWRPSIRDPPERIEGGAPVLPADRPGLGARLAPR